MAPHYACPYLTGHPATRASPKARCAPSGALWLPTGVTPLVAMGGRSPSNSHCRGLVLRALQPLPDRPPLSRGPTGLSGGGRRSTRCADTNDGLAACGAALSASIAQGISPGLWLVSHSLERCHVSGPTHGQTWRGGLRVARPTGAPCTGMGLETRHTGGQR